MAKKTSKTTCAVKGCRKKAVEDGLCQTCLDSVIPEEKVLSLTAAEAENWGRLYAELMNGKQAAQLLAFKQRELQRTFEIQMQQLEGKKQEALANAKEAQTHYEQLTKELCAKYKVEREFAVIDVDSRHIREERPGT